MSRPSARRFLLVALLVLVAGGIAAVTARADAPDVKVNSPAPGQHPFQTGTATVDQATGHVTVTLTGGWSWPTHGSDCNTNRAGAGVAVNWFDPMDRGFHVAYFAVNGGTVDNTPGGPDDFGVGATGADGLNPTDDVVHPTENDTGNTAVVDITDPSNFAAWRGGCGVYSTDTILVNNGGNLSYSTATVSHGNFGKATPASVDSSGTPFNDPTPPSDPSLQGALLSHVYESKSDVTMVCALMYDVHGGTDASNNGGAGIPGAQQNVTAGDQAVASGASYKAIHNSDNSIQSNGGTPTGNTCPQFFFPDIATKLSESSGSVGDTVTDSATLSNASSDASGTVTYTVYSDSSCKTQFASGGTVNVTNGSVPDSNPVTFGKAGTYYWQAAYSGDAKNGAATSACTSEQLTINPAAIQIVKTADKAQVNAGEPIGFTVTVYNTGAGDARGVQLSDTLPVRAGLSWSIDAQGAGWANTCAIAAGVLSCGPERVPAHTTKAASTFTVHITSPTTAATGGTCPGGSGVVSNTGSVSTTNDGSGSSTASTCVAAPAIQIVKTADKAQVNAGEPIGFTVTVYNTGSGDAHGVALTDTLPVKDGLDWSIDAQGAGWAGSCAIAAGVLSCGPATVPANTTKAASTFTVHITSPTTAATGGTCPGGSGVVTNTGSVSTTNDGSGSSTASTCVASADIQIVKTADAAQVNEGEPIGFTLTVWNKGTGDAKGVVLTDTLPTNAGLDWSIDSQGAGWSDSCAIAAGVLSCGPATVPANTTKDSSSFTVHITSPTTAATGGNCPSTGVVTNTGSVSTTNDGSGSSTASTCVEAQVDLSVTKVGSPQRGQLPENITWTMVVTNNGPDADTGVMISDPMPTPDNTFVSATTTQGSCTGGAILNCDIGDMAAGATVTITLVTTPSQRGTQTNTVTVVGDLPETNTANNMATATVVVVGPHKPPVFCVAVSKIRPKQLFVGRKTTLTIHLTKHHRAVGGIRVRIKGSKKLKFNVLTKRSNSRGVIKKTVKLKKAGILVFTPLASKHCNTKRIGVTGVFTPPVTG